jgi:hypothetical protein
MKDINFTDVLGIAKEYSVKPASQVIPQWYKDTPSYYMEKKIPMEDGSSPSTIKRCMPVFDAITAGYIIPTYTDLECSFIKNEESGEMDRYYKWASFKAITFHPFRQVELHPDVYGLSVPKWECPWRIQTPPGYSVYFKTPAHTESPFLIMEGIVDTDKYNFEINFPFVLKDPKFEGIIPAGTPLAQVIPFKRESWKMHLDSKENFYEDNEYENFQRIQFFDFYKTFFRQKKEYK